MSILGDLPAVTRGLMQALVHARARQREAMLPEPVGVILPNTEEYKGFTHVFGLQIVLVDDARPGLIIPLEIS